MPRRDLDDWFWQVGAEMRRLDQEMFQSRRPIAGRRFWEPKADVVETEDGRLVIKVELAGVRAEDIQLAYLADSHTLVIRGVRNPEGAPEMGAHRCHQLEVLYGEFQREIALPEEGVDLDNIRAIYRNGFLYVTMPIGRAIRIQGTVVTRKV